jgi:phage gp36-like protein
MTMSYATADDLIARYPNRDLVQLTNEDPAATAVNTSALQQALNDAAAEIDGYLEGRFALPLAQPPAVLNRLACDIAMYRLQSLRPLHDLADARKRYEDAIGFLLEAAKGTVTLGLSSTNQEPPSAPGASTVQGPQRVFDRDKLKGF